MSLSETDELADKIWTDSPKYLSVDNTIEKEEYKIYKERWYVLFVFCFVTFNQDIVYNTWSPISESAYLVFNWSPWMIPLINILGMIPNTFGMPLSTWLLETKGLRWVMIGCASVICAGCALRMITAVNPAATWLINISALLNGFASPPTMAAPTMLSNTWFPVEERSTATAIGTIVTYLGYCFGYILGPLVVQFNGFPHNLSYIADSKNTSVEDIKLGIIEDQRQKIMFLMYLTFASSLVELTLTIVYFPSKPPLPPSKSASVERVDFSQGCKDLSRNKPVWIILMAYAIPSGIFFGWGSVLDIILTPLGISQIEAGWIGFVSTLSGAIMALIIARLSDRFQGKAKKMILSMYFIGGVLFLWTSLISIKVAPFSLGIVYFTIIVAVSGLNGTVPLLYEIAAEAAYPVAECVSTGALVCLANVFGAIILFLFFIPNLNTDWVTWIMTISMFVGFFVLCFYKEDYKRLKLDNADKN